MSNKDLNFLLQTLSGPQIFIINNLLIYENGYRLYLNPIYPKILIGFLPEPETLTAPYQKICIKIHDAIFSGSFQNLREKFWNEIYPAFFSRGET